MTESAAPGSDGEAIPNGVRAALSSLVREAIRSEVGVARPRLVPAADVAAMLGISASKVEHLTALGHLRPVYIGGARRYDVAAVEAYVRALPTEPVRKRGPKPAPRRGRVAR